VPGVARRLRELTGDALVAAARTRLRRRADVRRVEALARESGVAVRITGGSVRDAFLACLAPAGAARARPGDLDLALAPAKARSFAALLARRAGTRVLELGASPRRVLRIPCGPREVDVWEEEGGAAQDLLRRDFTVNALSFELPGGRFASPQGALADLRARRLALPRPGVLLEDPLRVLRAARFVATLPGFRLAKEAGPEMLRAAPLLASAAPERRLAEMDLLLAAAPQAIRTALLDLERWGALAALVPGASSFQRRAGVRLAGRLVAPAPPVARALFLVPLGLRRALEVLTGWRVSRKERRLAGILLALPLRRRAKPIGRREAVLTLRAVHPFQREAALFLVAAGDPGTRALGTALGRLAPTPAAAVRLVRPRRPLSVPEIARLLGAGVGPELGFALSRLDAALSSGDVRGIRATRLFLGRMRVPAR
jgi:tRNA nucleotidyltransferase/poly(A) polymerase